MENEGWTLEDDLKLLDGIHHSGYGNWTDVASRFTRKTPEECEQRYLDKFIENPDNEDLKLIVADCEKLRNQKALCNHLGINVEHKDNHNSVIEILQVEDYLKDLHGEHNNIRGDDVNCVKFNNTKRGRHFVSSLITCTNYNSKRSDFDVEYDDKAEVILEMLWEPPEPLLFSKNEDNQLMKELKYVVADCYNFRLSERIKRKKIIRNHGLIDMRKTYSMNQRFKVPFGSCFLTTLFPVMKFIQGPELDYLLEKLLYENELRNKINSLLTFRSLGIRFLHGINIYEKLNKKRLKYKEEIGFNGAPLQIETADFRNSRRPSAPLALYNLPGFHLLDEDEKHLCSTARIVPETYHTFKNVLISECRKHNGLKLAQARHLLKIDVNKTRKMYDHLISTGDIWS